MIKTRILGVVLVKSGVAVQSVGFRRFLPIGTPEIAIHYLDRWGIDEIVVLHIDPDVGGAGAWGDRLAACVRSYARECRVPLAVGGGIRDVADVKKVVQAGADKVVVNTALIDSPETVSEAVSQFGRQCIVASIDAKRQADGTFGAWTHGGSQSAGRSAAKLASDAQKLGVGEIFINSIDCDGAKSGYDVELIHSIVHAVEVPVIACGGAGHPEHMRQAIRIGASAVAAGNFFHFTEHSVVAVKKYLKLHDEVVRVDGNLAYEGADLTEDGRMAKRDDEALEALRFQYIPEEKI